MKIGIIGTGITGNSAAWLLHEKHEITVFEQNNYIGGHSNTVSSDRHPDVDTGFIVYNEWTYPNLIALFDHLGVATEKTDMSFGVSLDHGRLEYAGHAMFAQKLNLVRPRYYKMILDLLRFYKNAPKALDDDACIDMSLGQYLTLHRYSKAFIQDHLLPMAAAIWSTSADDVRQFPVKSFVQFFVNHGLFLLKNRPQWWTVSGGSQRYVEKLTAGFQDKIKTNTKIASVFRDGSECVIVQDKNGSEYRFDHVIMASHADESLAMLSDANPREKDVLSAFPYEENTAYLHTDEALMPHRNKAWASWNYLATTSNNRVSLSYWMNQLQPFIGKDQDLFVTLNPETPPAPDKTFKTITYHHPQYTLDALKGWENIKTIQGKNRVWFCGAWCGYGFHEDGLSAGLAVAESLSGLKRPWDVQDKSPAGHHARPE